MRRSRITITVDTNTLMKVDKLVDKNRIRNRSHAIEYALNQFLKSTVTKAVVLAGGTGSSLRPYTYEIPKTLLPVKGKAVLERLIAKLKASDITEIILCIGYLGDKIKKYFGDGSKFGVKISYSEEKEPLQTGGALLKNKKQLTTCTFLVIHGDILTNLSYNDFIAFHQEQNQIATVALTTVDKPDMFGQLTLQGTKLVHFYQKAKQKTIKSHLIHGGIYLFEPEIFQYFPKNKSSFSLEDVIEKLISDHKVNGFVFEGQWFELGSAESYEKAIKEYTP